jgi:hypothetical protein
MARRRYEGARPPALFLPLRPLVFLSATCTMLSFAALVLAVDPVGLKDAASTAIGRTDAAQRGQCKRLHVERPRRSWPSWHCHSPGTSGNGRLGNYSQQKMVPTFRWDFQFFCADWIRARHSGQVAQRSATGSPLLPRMPARFDVPLPILNAVRGADRPIVGTGRSCAGCSGRETEVRSRAVEIAPGDTRHGRRA